MVLSIRSRLSLRFWTADSDISRAIFRDTENTIVPKTQKITMMGKSRENLLCFFCLSGFLLIGNAPLPTSKKRTARPGTELPRFQTQAGSCFCLHYTIVSLLLSIDGGRGSPESTTGREPAARSPSGRGRARGPAVRRLAGSAGQPPRAAALLKRMVDAGRHFIAHSRRKKLSIFLTASNKIGNKMTKIWGIDKPGKFSYPEKDERTPNKNRRYKDNVIKLSAGMLFPALNCFYVIKN